MIKKGGKLQVKLLIISFFLIVSSVYSQARPDTTAFKKDFEQLLKKYGIDNKGYMINVTSHNQQGGQIAFVITNNYFHDSVSFKTNVGFTIDTINNGERILKVYPLSGVWNAPFVATDTANAYRDFVDFGDGRYRDISAPIYWHRRLYKFTGWRHNAIRSKIDPVKIILNPNNPDEMYMFGDFHDRNKSYMYNRGKIVWMPPNETNK